MMDIVLDEALILTAAIFLGGYVEPPPEVAPSDGVIAIVSATSAHALLCEAPRRDCWMISASLCTARTDSSSAAPTAIGAWRDASGACIAVKRGASLRWSGRPLHAGMASDRWRAQAAMVSSSRVGWSAVAPIRIGVRNVGSSTPTAQTWVKQRVSAAAPILRSCLHAARPALPVGRSSFQRWRDAMPPPPGRWAAPIVTPPVPQPHPFHILLDDRFAYSVHVLLGADAASPDQVVVPVRSVYIVINTVTLARADTGVEIPVRGLSVGIGRDGPHWTWSATIPGAARALVARNPDPVELIAMVNGLEMRLLAESSERDRRHGADWLRVSGRSRSAWLSEQYSVKEARSNLTALTARQLADAVLTLNGVSIGWALDWQIVDWLVPSGAWSHYGTHMEALARLAEAGGGYLQADPAAQRIAVLPHYPVLPWHWSSATADIVLPEDVVEVERTITADQPEYNAVYVIGQSAAGRRDRVLRAGSAADRIAPQIVDALATDLIMTRARGSTVLAECGAKSRISLRLPVLPEVGLILPGRMMEYSAEGVIHRGLTRSLQGEWSHPELWQTVEIEVRE